MAKLRAVRLAVHLPLLGRCHEDFAAMPAAAGGRACARCEHVVHDLSAMTEREAARFVTAARGKRVCMRYVARADGTIEYRQEPARLAPALMVAALAACTPHEPLPQISEELGVEVVQEVGSPRVVVVPETPAVVAAPAVVEPPDDDINPCPPALNRTPKAKKKPPPGRKVPAKEPDRVEYVGFEG